MTIATMRTPWQTRTEELEPSAYADFSAWEEWMGRQCETPCELFMWWEGFDGMLRAQLYSIMYDLATREHSGARNDDGAKDGTD